MNEPMPRESSSGFAPLAAAEPASPGRSAGAMLRAAREKQGLHIAVLAATIKVSTAKLEALEHDRFDELPNATFVRALAQSVCRSLKVDPRPILALLPTVDAAPLESTVGRLNAPFQDRPGRDGTRYALTSKPLFWAGGLLLVAAIAVYWLPSAWLEPDPSAPLAATPAPTVAATALPPTPAAASVPAAALAVAGPGAASAAAAAEPAAASAPVAVAAAVPSPTPPTAAPTAAAAPPAAALPTPAPASQPTLPAAATTVAAAPAAAASARAVRPGIAQLSTSAESWIEVQDGGARIVLSRTLAPGESVGVDGVLPLRMKIGNVSGTQLTFRGQPVDLTAYARDNVARVELR